MGIGVLLLESCAARAGCGSHWNSVNVPGRTACQHSSNANDPHSIQPGNQFKYVCVRHQEQRAVIQITGGPSLTYFNLPLLKKHTHKQIQYINTIFSEIIISIKILDKCITQMFAEKVLVQPCS